MLQLSFIAALLPEVLPMDSRSYTLRNADVLYFRGDAGGRL